MLRLAHWKPAQETQVKSPERIYRGFNNTVTTKDEEIFSKHHFKGFGKISPVDIFVMFFQYSASYNEKIENVIFSLQTYSPETIDHC